MATCKSFLMLLALSVFVLFLASFTYAEESSAEELGQQGAVSDTAQISFTRRGRRLPRRQPDAVFRSPTQIIYSNIKKQAVQCPEQPIVPSVECQVPQPIIQTETIVRTIVQTATETVPQLIVRTLTCNVPQFIERTLTETNVETETVTQTVPRLIERTLTCTIPQLVERTMTETNVETETETVTQTVPRLIERTLTCTVPQLVERTMTETNVETETETVTQTVPQLVERTLTCTIPQYVERTLTCTIPQYVERTLTETVTKTQAAQSKHFPTYIKPLATTERSTFEASSRLTIIGTQKSSFETTKQPAYRRARQSEHRPFYTRAISSSVLSAPTASPIFTGSARSTNVEDNDDDDDMSNMSQPSGTYY